MEVAADFAITLPALPGDTPESLAIRLSDELKSEDAALLRTDFFGPRWLAPAFRSAMAARTQVAPVVCVDGQSCEGGIAGLQAFAVKGVSVSPIDLYGKTVGVCYEDAAARYAVLGDLYSPDPTGLPGAQGRHPFEWMEEALLSEGFDFHDIVRTWLFADSILDWYDDLNIVRSQFFRQRSLFGCFVPASTGTGMPNDHGAALVGSALAMRPKGGGASVRAVTSPLQCPALDYGSAFSRAAEMRRGNRRTLSVSGTASIAPGGATLHVGHVDEQIVCTMAVVEALLANAGYGFEDASRAIVYAAVPEAGAAYESFCRARSIPSFPTLIVRADICRDDLLFEIEIDAERSR